MGMQCEEVIDTMDDKIHNYLVKIGATDLDDPQIQTLAKDIDTISDLERVGDHLTNLLEFFQERYDNNIPLHPDSKAELDEMYDLLRKTLTEAVLAYEKQDKQAAGEVNAREEVIDRLTKKFRKNHIARIQDQSCSENESGYYVDILSNMERIGDHCENIVVNVLSEFYTHDDKFFTK
jgi:phosphate:Na+ symporter